MWRCRRRVIGQELRSRPQGVSALVEESLVKSHRRTRALQQETEGALVKSDPGRTRVMQPETEGSAGLRGGGDGGKITTRQ
ncbi:unnamed protein product [Arctogadus glacialis]